MNLFILLSLVIHTGTVRKKFDPILETQTDPILYKKKMEEIKDGEKGPPQPSFKFYQKSDFLTEPPFEDKSVQESPDLWGRAEKDRLPGLEEPIPEDLSDKEGEKDDEDWWADHWGDPSQEEEKDTWADQW